MTVIETALWDRPTHVTILASERSMTQDVCEDYMAEIAITKAALNLHHWRRLVADYYLASAKLAHALGNHGYEVECIAKAHYAFCGISE